MKKIWTTEVYCDKCSQNVKGAVYSDNMSELSEEQKEKAKEYLLHFHTMDNHLYCQRCKKHIVPEAIEDMIWNKDEQEWGLLCKECIETTF